MGMCFCSSSASICGDNGWSAWDIGMSVWHPASTIAVAQAESASSSKGREHDFSAMVPFSRADYSYWTVSIVNIGLSQIWDRSYSVVRPCTWWTKGKKTTHSSPSNATLGTAKDTIGLFILPINGKPRIWLCAGAVWVLCPDNRLASELTYLFKAWDWFNIDFVKVFRLVPSSKRARFGCRMRATGLHGRAATSKAWAFPRRPPTLLPASEAPTVVPFGGLELFLNRRPSDEQLYPPSQRRGLN